MIVAQSGFDRRRILVLQKRKEKKNKVQIQLIFDLSPVTNIVLKHNTLLKMLKYIFSFTATD